MWLLVVNLETISSTCKFSLDQMLLSDDGCKYVDISRYDEDLVANVPTVG